MSEISLTKEQYESLSYKHTKVKRPKTYGEIIGLLEQHGIHDYQFTKFQGTDVLAFPLTVKRRDKELVFTVKLTVPHLWYPIKTGGRYGPTTNTYLEDVSWRVFWWYLKSKLEAIEYGISDEVREFMYNITYSLPDISGNPVEYKLGEAIMENVDQLKKLTYVEPEERRIIEAENNDQRKS